jgi:hypothetical protein
VVHTAHPAFGGQRPTAQPRAHALVRKLAAAPLDHPEPRPRQKRPLGHLVSGEQSAATRPTEGESIWPPLVLRRRVP